MKKKVVIECTESEVLCLIHEHISKDFDSIVAAEELGNQCWNTTVSLPDQYDEEEVSKVLSGKSWGKYSTSSILNVLCNMGHLEAGDYVIDCTW